MISEQEARHAYSIVGELILIASALDNQLNQICISVLSLTPSALLEPTVASIDSARKIDILKAYASKLKARDWKKALLKHAQAVDNINRWRNIAAHSVISFHGGRAILFSPSTAKLLKSINLAAKTADKISFRDLEAAIKRGETALTSGQNLLSNYERVTKALALRKKQGGT